MKYPLVFQKKSNDCGPSCIFTLCEYYKISYTPKTILSLAQLTPKGTNIWNMQLILKSLGFSCKAIIIEDFSDYNYSMPIIALIKTNQNLLHYVIIYKKLGGFLLIGDPSFGLKYVQIEKFLQEYTHMVIIPQIITSK